MYVNPFWFGVICTVVAEVAIVLVCAVIAGGRGDDR